MGTYGIDETTKEKTSVISKSDIAKIELNNVTLTNNGVTLDLPDGFQTDNSVILSVLEYSGSTGLWKNSNNISWRIVDDTITIFGNTGTPTTAKIVFYRYA